MSHLYKASEWQNPSGRWYVADVEDLGGGSAYWWIPPRLLDLSFEDYILLLLNKYKVSSFNYSKEKNVLIFSWSSKDYAKAHQYLLDINKIARKKKFII